MKQQADWARRLTVWLFAHARRVMPPDRAEWAAAMAQEAADIRDPNAKLSWAMGCVAASYVALLKTDRFFWPLLARLYLSYVCLSYAFAELNSNWQAIQCQRHGSATQLRLPFDPFAFPSAYISTSCAGLIWALPIVIKLLWLMGAIFYLFAALRLLQNRASALALYFCGLASAVTVFALRQFINNWYFNGLWYWEIPPLWRLRFYWYPGATLFFGVLLPVMVGLTIWLVLRKGGTLKIAG